MKVTVELGRALGGDDDIRYRAGSQMGTPSLEETPSPPFKRARVRLNLAAVKFV